MSTRYPGGLITKTPVVPTLASAPGVWTLEQALAYIKAGTWPFPGALDPFFNQTTLLLHGDGNQGATNLYNSGSPAYLAFADNSNNNFPITVQGDSYGSVFSPYEGNYSNFFDGTGDYLSVASATALNLATGAFTIEGWMNISATSYMFARRASAAARGFTLYYDTSNSKFTFLAGDTNISGWEVTITSTNTFATNQWVHVAITRNASNVFTLWINGVSEGTVTSSVTIADDSSNLLIGGIDNTGFYTGYLSNFRLVKGTAVYTSAFTPPTAPLTAISGTSLLTCQSNRFIDNSSNNFAITRNGDTLISPFQPFTLAANDNGSGYFDGSGDRIQTTLTAQSPGTGDFTYQLWVYRGNANSACLFDTRNANNNTTGFTCLINGSSQLALYTNGTILTGSGTVPVSAWSFVSVSRSGTTVTLSLNGVSQGTVTFSNNLTDTNLWLGMYVDSTGPFTGYISDFRYIRGATASATPPTSPASNTANTQFLSLQYSGSVNNSGFIDNGPYDFSLTKVGNATQGTFSPFSASSGYWSSFYNTGSYMWFNNATNLQPGTSAFTLEMWLYYSSTTTNFPILYRAATSFPTYGYILEVSNDLIRFVTNDSTNGQSTLGDIAATALLKNQWFHLAIVREGTGSNQAKMYRNGVLVATGTMPQNLNDSSQLRIATNGSVNAFYNGYISNLRFVKGTAVYTSAFTPSTTPLTAITNTQLLTLQNNRLQDNSANNFAVAVTSGTIAQQTFSPFLPTAPYSISTNGGSLSLDGSGDYVRRGTSGNAAFNFGSGNFTIEMFVYQNALKNYASFVGEVPGTTNNSIHFGSAADGSIFVTLTSTNTQINAPAGTCRAGQWQHIALVRNSGVTTLYVDGTSRGTPFSSSANMGLGQSVGFAIGSGHGGGDLNGYISNVRILKGVAQYTTTFTPPTAPLTPVANTSLLCNFTNAGIFDNTGKNVLETVGNAQVDTNVKKYGIGSMKFDGSGDYLLAPAGQRNIEFLTGDFTIECWIRFAVVGNAQIITGLTAANTIYWQYFSSQLAFGQNNVANIAATNWSPATNTWYHIAVTRSGTTVRQFVDGVQLGTNATSSVSFPNGPIQIGSGGGGSLNGYIDDFRITKGVARYTTNFTPPTRAFPNQ